MKNFIKYNLFIVVLLFFFSLTRAQGLQDKIYNVPCLDVVDLKTAILMDLDQDGHYETIRTIWCNLDLGTEFEIISPFIYPPEASRGTVIIESIEDPNPYRRIKRKPGSLKPNFVIESFTQDVNPIVIYDFEKFEDDPAVYYRQYVPYTDVDDDFASNGIGLTPNPASDEVSMIWNHDRDVQAKIMIYNQTGQLVTNLGAIEFSSFSEYSFNISNLASGVYYIHTIVGFEKFVNPLYIVR